MILGIMLAGGASLAVAQEGTPETGESFPVNVTFLNAMTSLDAVDVYINGDEEDQRVVEGLEYGTTSEVFEGTAPATIVVIKQNVNLGFDRYLFDTVVPTQAGQNYLIVISDLLIIPTQLDPSGADRTSAHAQAVHAAAQAPAVDVYVTEAGTDFAIGDVVPIVTDMGYGFAGTGGAMPAGSYDVRLTQTGTDTVALEQDGVTVEAGKIYTFVLIGKPGSTEQPLTLVSVEADVPE
jgi:hypothetical protein